MSGPMGYAVILEKNNATFCKDRLENKIVNTSPDMQSSIRKKECTHRREIHISHYTFLLEFGLMLIFNLCISKTTNVAT